MIHSSFKPKSTVKMFVVKILKRSSAINTIMFVTYIKMIINEKKILMTNFTKHATFIFVEMVFTNKMNTSVKIVVKKHIAV